jgi:hypothetical protein
MAKVLWERRSTLIGAADDFPRDRQRMFLDLIAGNPRARIAARRVAVRNMQVAVAARIDLGQPGAGRE